MDLTKVKSEARTWESFLLALVFLLPLSAKAVQPMPDSFDDSLAMRVQIDEALNYRTSEWEKLTKAVALVEAALSSAEFRNEVHNYTYQNKKQFADNAGLTNEQIYRVIKAGAESYRKNTDARMDLELSMYYRNNRVVGYTYPNISRIFTNRKFFSKYRPASVAVNLVHEWTHKLGFRHDSRATAKRPHSVPYAIGRIVGNLATRVEAGETLSPYMGPRWVDRAWNPIPGTLPAQATQ